MVMKVLFAASECAPLVKVGGLGDVAGALPKALKKLGADVRVIIPYYQTAKNLHLEKIPDSDVPVYYVKDAEYFREIYPGGEAEYAQFARFCRGVADFIEAGSFIPDLVHLNDYHTGLVPLLLRERGLSAATLLTVHDLANAGLADPSVLVPAGLGSSPSKVLAWDLADEGKRVGMLLQGLAGADIINTVSPTYAKEILSAKPGGELNEVLKAREARFFGVLNGIDYDVWNPQTDKEIAKNYTVGDFEEGKADNKAALQRELGLEANPRAPLFGMVTRLVERKGIDLVLESLEGILSLGGQLVILGTGEEIYEKKMKAKIKACPCPANVSFNFRFDEALAHRIYAGADVFLMPSLFEPCGLVQIIAMRYGALPVVRATGGLKDTVKEGKTGFVFRKYSSEALMAAIKRSVGHFNDRPSWKEMVGLAMREDFSWQRSAREYLRLYRKVLQYRFGVAQRGVGEYRRNPLTGEWTILSPGRVGRLKKREKKAAVCPFDEGSEKETPPEVLRLGGGQPNSFGWQVRVVPNKFPILDAHEVIIHSPDHLKDIADLPHGQVELIFEAYRARYRHFETFGLPYIFNNHGREAAATLVHPHSQLLLFDRLPEALVEETAMAREYYRKEKQCPYCALLERTLAGRERLVFESKHLVVLTPFASAWPYEVMVLPKRHRPSFGDIKDEDLSGLALTMKRILAVFKKELSDPPYNFWLHSLADKVSREGDALSYHWHFELVPRLKALGGVELGAELMIDDKISPEAAARYLRERV